MIFNSSMLSFKEAALVLSLFGFFVFSCQKTDLPSAEANSFAQKLNNQYKLDLNNALTEVNKLVEEKEIEGLRNQFRPARLAFKRLEPIMGFFNAAAYHSLDQANLPKVEEEENSIKVLPPMGFQVLEEELFQEEVDEVAVRREINNIQKTLTLELRNLSTTAVKEYHFLWLVREQLVRTVALGISGFDSPVILYSLPENAAAFASLKNYFTLFQDKFTDQKLAQEWMAALDKAAATLNQANNFNEFDRYSFIKEQIHPMLALWKQTPKDWGVTFPFPQRINDDATSLFAANTFNLNKFSPSYSPKLTAEVIDLGKALFYDNKLSGHGKMSCGTCHLPEKGFTDGKKLAQGHDGGNLERNTPTLYYAVLQGAQFYDARVTDLEGQILEVVHNEKEFQGNIDELVKYVQSVPKYQEAFTKHYAGKINNKTVRNALASYVRSLAPFTSTFDLNISGQANTLSQDAIDGFNIFMGKAGCGTCHFAPVFNGTVPPKFNDSELEVLGVPSKLVWENATVDEDLGRFNLFNAEKKKHAFKTPTIRNASLTAPYMHNGVYNTLEEVIDFYNRGGGAGIGIELDNQTLPPDSLELTDEEVRKLVLFMESLKDKAENYEQ